MRHASGPQKAIVDRESSSSAVVLDSQTNNCLDTANGRIECGEQELITDGKPSEPTLFDRERKEVALKDSGDASHIRVLYQSPDKNPINRSEINFSAVKNLQASS